MPICFRVFDADRYNLIATVAIRRCLIYSSYHHQNHISLTREPISTKNNRTVQKHRKIQNRMV